MIPECSRGSRVPGQMDLKAVKDSKTLAIEVETGKSLVLENVKHDLLARVHQVVVVATSKEALQKIQRQLDEERLIIPSRLKVVIAGTQVFEELSVPLLD